MTLSGTITAANLNAEFSANLSSLLAVNTVSSNGKSLDLICDSQSLSNTSIAGIGSVVFTAEDDMEFSTALLRVISATAGIVITATITAVLPSDLTLIPKYILDDTLSLSTTSIIGETEGSRLDRRGILPAKKIFFIKGITYRINLTSSSATAVTRAYCIISCIVRRRRQ